MVTDSDWTISLPSAFFFFFFHYVKLLIYLYSTSHETLDSFCTEKTQCGVALHVLLGFLFMAMIGFNVLYSTTAQSSGYGTHLAMI